jgi:hypothetical protein
VELQEKRPLDLPRAIAAALAAGALLAAATADVLLLIALPAPPPAAAVRMTWGAIAIGIAAGCLAVLLHILLVPRARRPRWHRRLAIVELAALGLVLGAWSLRGHPGIPPDPPLVVAQFAAAVAFAAAVLLRRRAPGMPR